MQTAALLISAVQPIAYGNSLMVWVFLLLSLTVRMEAGDLFWFSLALAVFIAFSAIWNLYKIMFEQKAG